MRAKQRGQLRSSGQLFFCYRCRRFKHKPPALVFNDKQLCRDCKQEGKDL